MCVVRGCLIWPIKRLGLRKENSKIEAQLNKSYVLILACCVESTSFKQQKTSVSAGDILFFVLNVHSWPSHSCGAVYHFLLIPLKLRQHVIKY